MVVDYRQRGWHQFMDFFVAPNYMIIENQAGADYCSRQFMRARFAHNRVFSSWLENVYIDAHFGFCENLLKCLHLLKNRSLACHVEFVDRKCNTKTFHRLCYQQCV